MEDADGARAADVVGHEDIDVDPDVLAGRHAGLSRVLGQDLFGHRHAGHVYISCEVRFLETRKYSGADGGLPTSQDSHLLRQLEDRDAADHTIIPGLVTSFAI